VTTGSDEGEAWTFDGAARAHLIDSVRRTSATDRVRILEELLDLAESSGALSRLRVREKNAWDRLWSGAE